MVILGCSRCGKRREVKPQTVRKNGVTPENNLCRKCWIECGNPRQRSTSDRSALNYLLELAKIRKLHLEAKVDESS